MSATFRPAAEILEFLASLPPPEEILELRPSEALRDRVRVLLERSRQGELHPGEEADWERYESIEHLVRCAKIIAREKLGIPLDADA
jgi:hypothetical protein